jgi:hypothetical protein
MTGPVQVLVVGLGDRRLHGQVLEEFSRLRAAGVVRLLDVLVVQHDDAGDLVVQSSPAGAPQDAGSLAIELFKSQSDGEIDLPAGELPSAMTWSLQDSIPRGTTAAVALIEHLWAEPVVSTIRAAGGTLLEETWLAPDDVKRVASLVEQ